MRIEVLFFIALITIGISLGIASTYAPKVEISEDFCQTDEECAPAECCHPLSCVDEKYKPDCGRVFCTQVCQGPIDCGAGRCGCVNNKCQVVPLK